MQNEIIDKLKAAGYITVTDDSQGIADKVGVSGVGRAGEPSGFVLFGDGASTVINAILARAQEVVNENTNGGVLHTIYIIDYYKEYDGGNSWESTVLATKSVKTDNLTIYTDKFDNFALPTFSGKLKCRVYYWLNSTVGNNTTGETEFEFDLTDYSSYYESLYKDMIQPSGTLEVDTNGTYNVFEYENVHVDTPRPIGEISIEENGVYNVSAYARARVNVSATVVSGDDGSENNSGSTPSVPSGDADAYSTMDTCRMKFDVERYYMPGTTMQSQGDFQIPVPDGSVDIKDDVRSITFKDGNSSHTISFNNIDPGIESFLNYTQFTVDPYGENTQDGSPDYTAWTVQEIKNHIYDNAWDILDYLNTENDYYSWLDWYNDPNNSPDPSEPNPNEMTVDEYMQHSAYLPLLSWPTPEIVSFVENQRETITAMNDGNEAVNTIVNILKNSTDFNTWVTDLRTSITTFFNTSTISFSDITNEIGEISKQIDMNSVTCQLLDLTDWANLETISVDPYNKGLLSDSVVQGDITDVSDPSNPIESKEVRPLLITPYLRTGNSYNTYQNFETPLKQVYYKTGDNQETLCRNIFSETTCYTWMAGPDLDPESTYAGVLWEAFALNSTYSIAGFTPTILKMSKINNFGVVKEIVYKFVLGKWSSDPVSI